MITSRALRHEEPKQRPQQMRVTPPTPAVKYASIHQGEKRYNSSIGRDEVTIQAIDAETGEVIASETVRHFNLAPSQIIGGEGAVRAAAKAAGYTIKN